MKVTKKAWGRLRLGMYGLVNAGLGVAVIYNVMDGQQSAAWLLLGNAALTVAFFNTDLSDEGEPPRTIRHLNRAK